MRRASRTGCAMLLLAAAAVAPAACGENDDDRDRDAPVDIRGVGLMSGNSTAQFANCRDWRGGSVKRRYATIEDIRGQLTPQSSKSAESDLSDEDAYRIFQRVCAAGYSDSCGSTSSTPTPRPSRRSPLTRAKPIRRPERFERPPPVVVEARWHARESRRECSARARAGMHA